MCALVDRLHRFYLIKCIQMLFGRIEAISFQSILLRRVAVFLCHKPLALTFWLSIFRLPCNNNNRVSPRFPTNSSHSNNSTESSNYSAPANAHTQARIYLPLIFGNVCDVHLHSHLSDCTFRAHFRIYVFGWWRVMVRTRSHAFGWAMFYYTVTLTLGQNSCRWLRTECSPNPTIGTVASLPRLQYRHTHTRWTCPAMHDHLFWYFIALHT